MLYILMSCTAVAPFPAGLPSDFGRYLGIIEPVAVIEEEDYKSYSFDVEDGPKCLRGDPFQMSSRIGDSNSLLIYLQGGGACWSDNCLAYSVAPSGLREFGVLNTEHAQNPFADWNVGYVPYCDGSIFGGDCDIDDDEDGVIDRYHRGFANLSVALETLHHEFPDPDRIVLVGISGGGYGALAAAALVRMLWSDRALDVIADSGLGLGREGDDEFLRKVLSEWNAFPLFPDDCDDCLVNGHATGFTDWMLELDPHIRYLNISSEQDYIIGNLFLGQSGSIYSESVHTQTQRLAQNHPDQYRRFIYPGIQHTALAFDSTTDFGAWDAWMDEDVIENLLGRFDVVQVDGVTTADWVRELVEQDELPRSLVGQ
ncbi:MAG: pectin acetylesterase-family hydrolase [Myxococcota bacterium]|nr:pectin acetylesterase-family hydrolase [Myxococcota bacterium]